MIVEVTRKYNVKICNDCPYFKEIEDRSVCEDSFDEPNYDWYCTNWYSDNSGTELEKWNNIHGKALGGSYHRNCECQIPVWCPFKNKQ